MLPQVTILCHLDPISCACAFPGNREGRHASLEAGSLTKPGARLAAREPHNLPISASHSPGVLGAHVTDFYAGSGIQTQVLMFL